MNEKFGWVNILAGVVLDAAIVGGAVYAAHDHVLPGEALAAILSGLAMARATALTRRDGGGSVPPPASGAAAILGAIGGLFGRGYMTAVGLVFLLVSCSSTPAPIPIDPAAQAFGLEEEECVNQSSDRDLYEACRARVRAKYAPLMPPGVAP